jgi:hypothetical protein
MVEDAGVVDESGVSEGCPVAPVSTGGVVGALITGSPGGGLGRSHARPPANTAPTNALPAIVVSIEVSDMIVARLVMNVASLVSLSYRAATNRASDHPGCVRRRRGEWWSGTLTLTSALIEQIN